MALTPRPIKYTLTPRGPHHIYYPSHTKIVKFIGYVLANTIHVGPKCVVTILRQKCTHRRLFPQLKVSQNSDGMVGATSRRPHIPMLTVSCRLNDAGLLHGRFRRYLRATAVRNMTASLLSIRTRLTLTSATFITGCTAAGHNTANVILKTHVLPLCPYCLGNYGHDGRPLCAPVQPTPLIVYNLNSNALFHSRPYAAQYSVQCPSANAPLNPGHADAAPDVVETHTTLPLSLHT